jgi:hypothetical protein
MVDGAGRDRPYRHRRQDSKDRYQQEYGPLREYPTHDAGDYRDRDVPSMVESRITAIRRAGSAYG